jgi:hypothetical protein
VIGIVVAVDARSDHRTAWMIPVEAAVRYCPSLADALAEDNTPQPWPPGADREITAALVKVPSVYDPARRDSVLRDTGEDIAFLTQRSPVLLEDVRNMVATCLQYADGIDRLAAAVRWYERGSLPEREFERVLERLRAGARPQEYPR